jgi:integrase/recombinase XerD
LCRSRVGTVPTQNITMANPFATTAIFIDRYHPRADGTCAVSIRVTHDRKKKYYPTPYALKPDDYQKVMGEKPRSPFKEIRLKLNSLEEKAASIIAGLQVFTWLAFEKAYLSNKAARDTVESAFTEYAEKLRGEARIGTAVSYECARNSLKAFAPGAKFADITPEFLRNYEKWMSQNGNSITTVGIYLRSLRTIYNNVLAEGLLSKELYPFGKRKYEIPTGKNIKKALTLEEISRIYYYVLPKGSTAEMCRDMWFLMYLCNGINVKDLCLLKYSNIQGDTISFIRAKTERTKRQVEPIRVLINEEIDALIQKWGNEKNPRNYIFPVLQEGQSPERQRQLIQQYTHLINDHMKAIAPAVGIEKPLTTYAARHSFATILQRSGTDISLISEAIGHASEKTTQNYLAGFEDDAKRETMKALTAFKINN